MRIYLTGFMGAGKNYLGQALAERLGFGFIDVDQMIETQLKRSIPQVFEHFGEAGFREIEANCLRTLADRAEIVVATGGGAPCFHGNMAWMNESGITIYLHAPATLLAKRLLTEKHLRPLIADVPNADLTKFIEDKLMEREVFYRQCQLQFMVPAQGMEGLDGLIAYLERFFVRKIKRISPD